MTATAVRTRPLVLCILDGLGERAEQDGNAVRLAKTPTLDALAAYPRTTLAASGPDVGLPKGRVGNGAAGYTSLGAGRVVPSDASRVDAAIAGGKLLENPVVADVLRIAKHHFQGRLHLFGLLSDGGVHSELSHLHALIDAAHHDEIPVVVHAFLDGRDTPPRSAARYVEQLENVLGGGKKGEIGTLIGRSYAMDREGRWDRTHLAYKAIVRGVAPRADTAVEALNKAYATGKNDATIEPVRIGAYSGMKGDFMCDFAGGDRSWRWFGEENGFAWSLRTEGLRQLTAMLLRRGMPREVEEGMLTDRGKPVTAFIKGVFASMTEIDPSLDVPAAFPREIVRGSFGEAIAAAGLTQLRCAESDRQAHVTTFFSGGREGLFDGEERAIVPSPSEVATYDLAPGMSAPAVAEKVVGAIAAGKHDVIVVSFANPDAVAHTSNLDAAVRAVEAADAGLGAILAAVREAGGALVVTADHGNCERMKDTDGRPHPAHTTSPVPFYYANENDRGATLREGGRLADVAPTLLALLGVPQPEAMTGRSLLAR